MSAQMIWIEVKKLQRSLIVPLCLVAPGVVAVAMGLISARQAQATWVDTMRNGIGLWAYFMLPMTVTAFSALMASVEHRGGMWDHLLALPISRWRLFAAKAIVMMLLVASVSLLLALGIYAVGALVEWLVPAKAPLGAFPWALMLESLAAMCAAAWCMCMLQLWVALHFRSFVPPLVLGLTGTFVTVVAVSARESVLVPWAMPVNVLIGEGTRLPQAVALGVTGGLLVLASMVWHLSRQEA
jgi:lantibiotic transport system permease protein